MHVLFEIMVQIKQKRGIGVENPSPRSFSGGKVAWKWGRLVEFIALKCHMYPCVSASSRVSWLPSHRMCLPFSSDVCRDSLLIWCGPVTEWHTCTWRDESPFSSHEYLDFLLISCVWLPSHLMCREFPKMKWSAEILNIKTFVSYAGATTRVRARAIVCVYVCVCVHVCVRACACWCAWDPRERESERERGRTWEREQGEKKMRAN